jgi:hypothetical protein
MIKDNEEEDHGKAKKTSPEEKVVCVLAAG